MLLGNIYVLRIMVYFYVLRLHVLLLLLMKSLLQKVSSFNRVKRELRSKLSLLLLISCFLRAVLTRPHSLQSLIIPSAGHSLAKLSLFFIVVNVFTSAQVSLFGVIPTRLTTSLLRSFRRRPGSLGSNRHFAIILIIIFLVIIAILILAITIIIHVLIFFDAVAPITSGGILRSHHKVAIADLLRSGMRLVL
jgi:hypothetical protein